MKKKEMKRLSLLLLTLAFEGSWQWLSETNLKSLRKRKMKNILLRLTLLSDLMLFWTFGDLPSCLVQRLVPLGRVFHLKKLQGTRRGKILIMAHCWILMHFELGYPIVNQFNKSAWEPNEAVFIWNTQDLKSQADWVWTVKHQPYDRLHRCTRRESCRLFQFGSQFRRTALVTRHCFKKLSKITNSLLAMYLQKLIFRVILLYKAGLW